MKFSSHSSLLHRELSELHKVTAVNKSAAHEAVLSAEQTARQELTEALEKQRVEHHREKEQLLLEVYISNVSVLLVLMSDLIASVCCGQ